MPYGITISCGTDGIGDVGDQSPCVGDNDKTLPLARMEAIPVDASREDLAVDHDRQRDFDGRLGRENLKSTKH